MKWNYYSPEFECDKINVDLLRYSPWSGHRNFIYDLMANWKPHTVVELGSYYGCSAFAIAQAIKDFQLLSVFYGVDTWRGDDFTQTDYQQDVYHDFCKVKDACYSDKYVKMLRMTFDEAVSHFKDETIDLLHIDGSHHYEDVQHDFVSWKNKVKKDGIILFHDISPDKIDGQTMGSCQFWRELTEGNPYHLQFDFSMGLGILFLCEETYEEFKKSYVPAHYQALNNTYDVELKDEMRKAHFRLLDADFYISSLKEQIEIKDTHLRRYEKSTQEKDSYISRLENAVEQVREDYQRTIDGKNAYILKLESERESIKNVYEDTVSQKDAYIKELESLRESVKKDYQKTIEEKDSYILSLESERENIKNAYEDTISQKDAYIKKLETDEKDLQEMYHSALLENEKQVAQMEEEVQAYRRSYEEIIRSRDDNIKKMKEEMETSCQNYEKRILPSEQETKRLETEVLGLCEAVNELQIKYQKTMEYKLSRLLKGKEK